MAESKSTVALVVAVLAALAVGTGAGYAAGRDQSDDRATGATAERDDDGVHGEDSRNDDDGVHNGYEGDVNGANSAYEPRIDPSDFVSRIDNPYFPLEPGTVFRLKGKTDTGIEREIVTVTNRKKKILGVETSVIRDVVRVGGELAESTHDWYAQDRDGNVWYFGESTAEYEHGKVVSREGSWEAGVDGAQPGIIMTADPEVTDSYRQEYYRGEAEDLFLVVGRGGSKAVPFGDFNNVLRTLEWTRLEPNVLVEKFYAPGVGIVAERAISGSTEKVLLLDVTRR